MARPSLSAAEVSESLPKGFSTITRVHPLVADAFLEVHSAASRNTLGGMDM